MWKEGTIVQDMLTELRVVSLIPEEGKLCIRNNMLTIENKAWYTPIRRFLFMEHRKQIMTHIQHLLDDLENFLKMSSSIEPWIYQEINTVYPKFQEGLTNMRHTYTDDAQTIALLELMKARFDNIVCVYIKPKLTIIKS